MTLVRFKNRDFFPVRHSHQGMDDMFNWFNNEVPSFDSCSSYPSSNISESDEDFKIEMLVPGYSKDEIKIQVDNNILSVSHEIENEENGNHKNYISREFRKRSFNRRFKLSDRLASEKIMAKYDSGVLSIVIPKKEEAKAKPIREISIS